MWGSLQFKKLLDDLFCRRNQQAHDKFIIKDEDEDNDQDQDEPGDEKDEEE